MGETEPKTVENPWYPGENDLQTARFPHKNAYQRVYIPVDRKRQGDLL